MAAVRKTRTKGRSGDRRSTIRLLFTCVGRRVELLRAFREAASRLKIQLEIHGADASRFAPALYFSDRTHQTPSIASGNYQDALAGVIEKHRIDLLVPLIDTELAHIAAARERFEELGCRAVISSPRVIESCRDKLATFRVLSAAGIDTPMTWPWVAAMEQKRHRFPYFLKPRAGSAGAGNHVVNNVDELRVFGARVKDAIVQEFVPGVEHTLDVYTGFDGVPRCVVARKRLEVRTGEVSKGVTTKTAEVLAIGRRVAEVLGECRGVITVQCIVTADGRIRTIEINPRFGGGAPLSIRAGADFPRWLLEEHLGRRPRILARSYKADLAMLRFDDSVFVPSASRLLSASVR